MSKISPVVFLTVPKDLVARTEHWIHNRHVAFISSSHHRDGPCKLNLYTTSQAPLLKDPMDMTSEASEGGEQVIAFFETYTGMEGLEDHWKKGGESGMLPDFFKLMEEGVKGDFIQPVSFRCELNLLPKSPVEALSGACQVFVKMSYPKELEGEVLAFLDLHEAWMKETHLEEQGDFTGPKKLLYYAVGSCPLLSNPMDLTSGPAADGTQISTMTEIYASEQGLAAHWEKAKNSGWEGLSVMMGLQEKGMKAVFYQPMTIKGSVNWFGW